MPEPQDPTDRSVRAFLAQWKPVYVIGVDENDTEHRITVAKNTKRWELVTKALRDLDCVRVRAYDSVDNVLGTKVLRVIPSDAGIAVPSIAPATSGGVDVAAIVRHTTEALTQGFNSMLDTVAVKVVAEVTKAHEVSTKEMVALVKVATEDSAAFRKMVLEDINARRQAIEDERSQRDEEREQDIAEREIELQDKATQTDIIKLIIDKAGPKVMEQVVGGIFNGAGAPPPKPLEQSGKPAEGTKNGS